MTDRDWTYRATGTVYPARFVMYTANDGECAQATANARTMGISQEHTKYFPGSPADSTSGGVLAEAGDPVPGFGLGRKCLLELGGTVPRGSRVVSDSQGRGVVAAATGAVIQEVGAVAEEAGVLGAKILVTIERQPFRPALS